MFLKEDRPLLFVFYLSPTLMGNTHGTGFGKHSTTDDVARDISLAGKNVIVTGANTGLGQETTRALARMGANVIMGIFSRSICYR